MSVVADTLASINETSLDLLTSVQDGILEAYKNVTDALPTDSLPTIPTLPAFEPTAIAQLVDEAFGFQAKVLDANKSFALGLLGATAPAGKPAPAKTAKAAK